MMQSTEPYSPWSNFAEHEIRELKKAASRKLTQSGAPCKLWCFALGYKSYVCSHTSHDIYCLDGRVPETVISGETANISPFCEFGFWYWVKLWEKGFDFPEDTLVLGKYLGPSVDVGLATTQRIMKSNGEIKDHSTVFSLTPEECISAAKHQEWEKFLEGIQGRWGKKTAVKDWCPDVLNLVPNPENNNPWEDEDGPSFPKLDDELMATEVAGDFPVNTEMLLPVGNTQELARVFCQKSDQEGNQVGSAHWHAALDTHVYEVCFPDKRTEELAVIAEAAYAQCDANGNQSVLLDGIVDYHKDPSMAAAQNDQVLVIDGKIL